MSSKVADFMTRRDSVVMTSFPRSGSTLTRQYLAAVFRRVDSGLRAVPAGYIVPNYAGEANETLFERIPMISRTHKAELIGRHKTLYLFRRPDDVFLSYYVMRASTAETQDKNKFLTNCCHQWRAGVSRAIDYARAEPANIHLSCYEKYLESPSEVCAAMLQFIGVAPPVDLEQILKELNSRYRQRIVTEATAVARPRGVVGASAGF